jgi:hypothetical protein
MRYNGKPINNTKSEIFLAVSMTFLILTAGALLYNGLTHNYQPKKTSISLFIQNCTENKGIAVLDLENNMRCVSMLGENKL